MVVLVSYLIFSDFYDVFWLCYNKSGLYDLLLRNMCV